MNKFCYTLKLYSKSKAFSTGPPMLQQQLLNRLPVSTLPDPHPFLPPTEQLEPATGSAALQGTPQPLTQWPLSDSSFKGPTRLDALPTPYLYGLVSYTLPISRLLCDLTGLRHTRASAFGQRVLSQQGLP